MAPQASLFLTGNFCLLASLFARLRRRFANVAQLHHRSRLENGGNRGAESGGLPVFRGHASLQCAGRPAVSQCTRGRAGGRPPCKRRSQASRIIAKVLSGAAEHTPRTRTPRLFCRITRAADYWIARLRGSDGPIRARWPIGTEVSSPRPVFASSSGCAGSEELSYRRP